MTGLCALLGLALLGWRFCWSRPLQPGQPVPDFDLPGSDGRRHRLSDYRGQLVVLNWFPKAYTRVCTRQCQALRRLNSLSGVAVLAASCDFAATNRRFAHDLGLTYPLLSDPWRRAARACGVLRGLPVPARHTLYIGADGRLLRIDRHIDADQAGTDVLRQVEELRRG